jgi:hypothetical protein
MLGKILAEKAIMVFMQAAFSGVVRLSKKGAAIQCSNNFSLPIKLTTVIEGDGIYTQSAV